MTQQPEALRLAELIEKKWWRWEDNPTLEHQAAAELRRLHEVNAELLEALKMAVHDILYPANRTIEGHIDLIRLATAAIAKATGETA